MAKNKSKHKELWKNSPDEHDFPAAKDYLSLITGQKIAEVVVDSLKEVPTEVRKAKDLLRASGLPLLGKDDFHVALDLKKVAKGIPLSPVLLVRGSISKQIPLTVADGYHRICASYQIDENQDIPCKIAEPNFS
jgi:hypothetical protein